MILVFSNEMNGKVDGKYELLSKGRELRVRRKSAGSAFFEYLVCSNTHAISSLTQY